MKTRVRTTIAPALVFAMAAAAGFSVSQQIAASNHPSEPLKAYLRSYLSPGAGLPDPTTRITAVTVKTDGGKNKEYIVYVSGSRWCGSGGCTMLILEPIGSSFKVLGRVTIVQLPIRLLPSMANGHPDIGVRVQGGGVRSGYEAVLSFDGASYPTNPSIPPARKYTAARGEVIIATTEGGVPLYN